MVFSLHQEYQIVTGIGKQKFLSKVTSFGDSLDANDTTNMIVAVLYRISHLYQESWDRSDNENFILISIERIFLGWVVIPLLALFQLPRSCPEGGADMSTSIL